MIRKITAADRQGTFNLVKEFQEEALNKTSISIDENTMKQHINTAILKDIPCVFVYVKDRVIGLISGMIIPSFFHTNKTMAFELMWYVSKKFRGGNTGNELLNAFEEYAIKNKAEYIVMVAPFYSGNERENNIFEYLYKKKGYRKLETHYIKNLGG